MENTNIEIKVTKVPFSLEEMKDFFTNRNKFFIINYKDSELKGNRFLSYVGNLEVPFEVDYTGLIKEEKFELLQEFFRSRNIVKFNSLAITAAEVLLKARGIKEISISKNPIFSDSEKEEFIKNNKDIIEKWITFLISTNLFMLVTVKELNEIYDFKKDFNEIIDAHYIGQNVVQLFAVPSFMEIFFSVPVDREIFYFKHQFEDYMYKGNNLFSYFRCPENIPYIIFEEILKGSIKPEEVESLKQWLP